MNWRNTEKRYGSLPIAMHWLMLALLVGVYAAINLHDLAPKGSALRADLKTWHFVLGLGVLVLVALRLGIRLLSGPVPRIEPAMPIWQHRLAVSMHVTLYLFMIVMPVLGWFVLSTKGDPVSLLGVPLPALAGQDKELSSSLKEIHETLGTLGYYVIGLHAAAALVHHYLTRDNTLLRMLPRRR